jgi:hypothetical protein
MAGHQRTADTPAGGGRAVPSNNSLFYFPSISHPDLTFGVCDISTQYLSPAPGDQNVLNPKEAFVPRRQAKVCAVAYSTPLAFIQVRPWGVLYISL